MSSAATMIWFLIGLSSRDDPRGPFGWPVRRWRQIRRRRTALARLAERYEGLTAIDVTGLYGGEREPSLMVGVLKQEEQERVLADAECIAAELAHALGQECVGVAAARGSFALVTPALPS